jgi:hypothetical protein
MVSKAWRHDAPALHQTRELARFINACRRDRPGRRDWLEFRAGALNRIGSAADAVGAKCPVWVPDADIRQLALWRHHRHLWIMLT